VRISSTRVPVEPLAVSRLSVIEASLTWADIDATAAYVHGQDAVEWLQARPIRSALLVWADGTTTRLPADLNT
jgi:thiamine biosynthesis lipoprotein